MKELYLTLKNDKSNDIGWIKRFVAYMIDWYLGGVVASLPIIIIYMSLHSDASYIPQNLAIFTYPYNMIAGILSFLVACFYYVYVPMFIWNGQTLAKKIFHLRIMDNQFQEASKRQIFIRQFVVILIIEGSLFSSSNILHQVLQIASGLQIATIYSYIGIIVTICSILCMFFLKSRRAIHDLVAKTRVVNMNSKVVQYEIKKKKKKTKATA